MQENSITQVKAKAVLYRSKVLKDGSFPVLIRITKDRKSVYISTGHSLFNENWNELMNIAWETKPRISSNDRLKLEDFRYEAMKELYSNVKVHPKAKVVNKAIADLEHEIDKALRAMEVQNVPITSSKLKDYIKPQSQAFSQGSFLKYFKSETEMLYLQEKYGTWNRWDNAYKKLLAFILKLDLRGKYQIADLETKLKGKDLLFSDLTSDYLKTFELALRKSGLRSMSVESITKTFKAAFAKARKDSRVSPYIKFNPFEVYVIERGKPREKERLTLEEIKALEMLELEPESILWDIRNCFLFCFYTAGLRIGDLLQLRWENVVGDRLVYTTNKNGRDLNIKLLGSAKDILKLYSKSMEPKKYIFPFLDSNLILDSLSLKKQLDSKTAFINKKLKLIAQRARIKKRLVTHLSRHSFADIARQKEVSVYDIQQLLGHSSISITENYLASLDNNSKDSALEKVLNEK